MVGEPSSRAASRTGPAPAEAGGWREERPADADADADDPAGQAHRFQVFDGDGRFVGVFENWEAAHAWSHLRAAEAVTRLPVRIEDHLDRRTWSVEPGLCQLTVWRRHSAFSPASAATAVTGLPTTGPTAGATASVTSPSLTSTVPPASWPAQAAAASAMRAAAEGTAR